MSAAQIIVLIVMTLVFVIMISGLIVMAVGGKTSEKYSNKLMMARVGSQALVVFLIGVMFMVSR